MLWYRRAARAWDFNLLLLYRQQPSPLLYSIDIWPARNSRLTQRETNHYITRCASELAWPYLAGSLPGQLVIDLFCTASAICCMLSISQRALLPELVTMFSNAMNSTSTLGSFLALGRPISFTLEFATLEKMADMWFSARRSSSLKPFVVVEKSIQCTWARFLLYFTSRHKSIKILHHEKYVSVG